jgi:hypothetical protein
MNHLEITEFRTMIARLMHIGTEMSTTGYTANDLMNMQVAIEAWLGPKIGKPMDGGQLIEFRVLTGNLFVILSKIGEGDKHKSDLIAHQAIIEKWVDQQTGRELTGKVAPYVQVGLSKDGKKITKLK